MNNQYRLEDDIARNFPQQIAKLTETIDSYKADIAHYQEHKITDPEQFSMEISGKVFTEKKEAGAALLAVCKDMKAVDAAMDIGNYQGFNMRIQFDSWSKEFILSVKHESVSKVHLGADALGNITRINNLLGELSGETGRSGATIGNGTGAAYKCQRGSWKAIHKRRGTEPETGATVRTKCPS